MATLNNFYLNASTFDLATSVFSNASLTTFAPDGYYSNGLIVRQLVSGELLPAQGCTECGPANIHYVITKDTFRSCSSSITSLNLKIAQNAPSYNVLYVDQTVTTSTDGYSNIPTGSTKITFSFTLGASSCSRVKLIISINGVQVALQQFTGLTVGVTYQLVYTANITGNSTITAYATNY